MWNPKIRNPFSAATPVLRATRGACCCPWGVADAGCGTPAVRTNV